MNFGLDPTVTRNIQEVFRKHTRIDKVLLYGSRAKGNYRKGSDIDLTFLGNNLDLNEIHQIEEELEELMLPYTFDLSIFIQINNLNLVEHILRLGKAFYQKKTELPEEWQEKSLADICENLDSKRVPITKNKRIILDKAFIAIDQAKANIEKNIENTKELFQSKTDTLVRELENIYNLKQKKLEELKKSILQKAFADELTEKEVTFKILSL